MGADQSSESESEDKLENSNNTYFDKNDHLRKHFALKNQRANVLSELIL